MHYRNGREAKVGDKIVRFNNGTPDLIGVLVEANPGSTTCNGRVVPLPADTHYVTLGDCVHVDDVGQVNAATPAA